MTSVVHFDAFAPETVHEHSVRALDNGAKIVWLTHTEERVPLVLQTAQLRTPMGIQSWDETDGSKRYTMELAMEPNDAMYKALDAFDHRMVTLAMEAKSKWLKTKNPNPTRDVVEAMYTTALRLARDRETGEVTNRWPPVLRVKIPVKNGAFECELWDSKRQAMDMNEFIKNSRGSIVTAIVRCTGAWVTGRGFTTTWKAQQILVHNSSSSALRSFAFLNPEKLVEEEAEGGPQPPPPRKAAPAKRFEAEEEEEVKPAKPAPAPAKAAKPGKAAEVEGDDEPDYLSESD